MSVGAPTYGLVDLGDGTSTTAGYPTGNVGDLILFWVASGETSDTLPVCTTAGFTKAADTPGGSGAYGNNGGIRHLTLFTWEADTTVSGTVTATIGGSATGRTIMSMVARVPKGAGDTWAVTHAVGNDTTSNTSVSIATTPTLAFAAGDVALAAAATAFDVPSWSGQTLSATGATFGAFTVRVEDETTTGNDVHMLVGDATVTAGPATGATTFSATLSGSGTAGGIVTRLAVTGGGGGTPNSGSGAGTLSWAGAASGSRPSQGIASGAVAFAGAAAGSRTSDGAGGQVLTWAGAASGSAPTVGVHSGAGAGTLTWAGMASGSRMSQGSGAGAIDWAGAASGVGPTVGVNEGSGAGSIVWAGGAAGSRPSQGTGAGTLVWVGAATGSAPIPGQNGGAGSGTLLWTGSASGSRASAGGGVGLLEWVGTATGERESSGAGAGLLAWLGAATGSMPAAAGDGTPVAHPALTLTTAASGLTLTTAATDLALTVPTTRLEIT